MICAELDVLIVQSIGNVSAGAKIDRMMPRERRDTAE
jgi:hypothetical protein